QALQSERTKSESLARELTAVRREGETQAAALKKANEKPDNSKALAEAQQALRASEAEREKLAQALRSQTAAITPASPAKPTAAPAPAPAPAPTPTLDTETRRLMAQARQLVDQRNIVAARSVLERAADSGHPPAVFALAETYDPNVLAAWGTIGTQGDAE